MPKVNVAHRAPGRRLFAVTVTIGALLLGACGPPPSSGGGSGGRAATGTTKKLPPCPLDALEKATGKVKVNLWFGGIVSPPVDVLKDLIKAFNQSQDKIVVTADDQGTAYAEVLRKYEGASSKPKQLPQMILVEDTALGEMVDKGQILPAQSCMEADGYDPTQIIPSARAHYEVDGVLYPAFFNVSTPVLYYNKVHFKKAGLDPDKPPGTLAEMAAAARKIKAAKVAPKPISFLTNQWFFNTWLAGVGQDAVNNRNGRSKPPTKATFDTAEAQGALTSLDNMNKEGLLNPFPVTDGSIDHYLALITEQSSMLIETSTASGTIAQALAGDLTGEDIGVSVDPSLLDAKKVLPGSGPMPGLAAPGKVYASGGGFYILNTSSPAQQAASWKFFKFMLQEANAKKWTVPGGYLPMVKAVNDDPEVAKYFAERVDGVLLKPAADQLAAADPDQAGPLIGAYTKYGDAIEGALEGVLFNGADPKAALTKASDEVDALLRSYNGD
ncbi:MAG: extracellular solute-binding protein [Acidimicrobiales bacterium]